MDAANIASLATSLDSMQLNNQVSTLVLKKALDNQQSVASGILDAIPQLPANPAIGRNINTTA
ncbi:YjfB family protein [Siccibacter colletis]|uniref:YjfB family protein n=1 Tax=Siccibacter colletis TaxID=1505757 RepID=A0ABY6JIF8_9ENTR|nr:YjfB family protein [Siccibacter colletis]UYU33469.1 YjfB family protein [Siccibacter colletis]WNN50136.1 YjfB family protein [Siccibacter colletis]